MIDKRGANMRNLLIVILIAGIVSMASVWVYNFMKTDQQSNVLSIEKDNAKSLEIDVDFGVGDLLIEGGATEWVDGNIDTNMNKGYPSVKYNNKRDVGYIEIEQKPKRFTLFQKKRNDWDLQLTNEVPVSLDVDTGVSDSDLNLAGIQLTHLSVDAGVGDTTIDLSGDWQESFEVDIDLGVGDADIRLPKDTSVKITVSKGIGKVAANGFISQGDGVYVNEAYDQSDTTITMDVDVGIGNVKFSLAD